MAGWLGTRTVTVADLFAGTGGMGLASLLCTPLRDRAKIIYTAELDSEYVDMIRNNYEFVGSNIASRDQLPYHVAPTDIMHRRALTDLVAAGKKHRGLTLLLAGPPCQGFSTSNRISRHHANPQNLLALRTAEVIKAARPLIAIIENVPGIRSMRSARQKSMSAREHIERQLSEARYRVQSYLLDAADYGVPQHRVRSFTIAIAEQIADAFDFDHLIPEPMYGPGRRFSYRTVREAFADLPSVVNGAHEVVTSYAAPAASSLQRELRRYAPALFDHVTSRHSPYVLKRYRLIPPGGNWTAIRHVLDNYSDPDNTHMNIYHRLDPDRPAKTIANFRKSMTVHPWEDRGLSLREAARLQSLPDWMRFFDDNVEILRGRPRGLGVRQQQVGNAVCFRLTQQLIAHLFADA